MSDYTDISDQLSEQMWDFILKNEDRFFEFPHVLQPFTSKITGKKTIGFFILYSISIKEC